MIEPRCAVVFGQLDKVADPMNLPEFNTRLQQRGIETILIHHDDSAGAARFLRGYPGKKAMVGASLGAMSVIVFACYMPEDEFVFAGGFQPSDFDPSGHSVIINDGLDVITRAIVVPPNVKAGLVFRNPIVAATGGLGHATWIAESPKTQLEVIKRVDPHPGDFGVAADQMFDACIKALGV